MHLSPVISQKKINAEIKLFDDKNSLRQFPTPEETAFHPSF